MVWKFATIKTEFFRSVIEFAPSIEREVNRSFLGDSSIDIGSWTKQFHSWLEYKHELDIKNKLEKKNKNRTETIGLVLCLRTIIRFHIKYGCNYDK